jgi:RNA polymerase binding protein RbpA
MQLRTHATRHSGIFAPDPMGVPDDDLAPRRPAEFACPRGHEFTVSFADDVVPPSVWECRRHGVEAGLKGALPQGQQSAGTRSHWDMLRERRPESELARLLDTQLNALRAGQLVTVGQWLRQAQAMRKGGT